jgi:hypothetical protein
MIDIRQNCMAGMQPESALEMCRFFADDEKQKFQF